MRTPRVYDSTIGQADASITDAFGDWIGGMADWDWFATMTFRDPSPEDQRQGWTRIGTGYAQTALRRWSTELQGACFGREQPRWVACMEFQKDRGVPHWHALVANAGIERRMGWVDWWYGRYGIARILPYDKRLGARYYLSKYVTKAMADIQFSSGLVRDIHGGA